MSHATSATVSRLGLSYRRYYKIGNAAFGAIGDIVVESRRNRQRRRDGGRHATESREGAKFFEHNVVGDVLARHRPTSKRLIDAISAEIPPTWSCTDAKVSLPPETRTSRSGNEFWDLCVEFTLSDGRRTTPFAMVANVKLHQPGSASRGAAASGVILKWLRGTHWHPSQVTRPEHVSDVKHMIAQYIRESEPLFAAGTSKPASMLGETTDYFYLSFTRSTDPGHWVSEHKVTSLLSLEPEASYTFIPTERWPHLHVYFTRAQVPGLLTGRADDLDKDSDYRRYRLYEAVAAYTVANAKDDIACFDGCT